MAERFHLEIVTPDRQFFIGEAESLILPAVDGQLGVLKGHAPMVTALEPGMLQFRTAEGEEVAVVGQGLAEIFPERVMVLASFAERPEEIDQKRAEAARQRAEERLRQKLSVQEYHNSKAALARALARLKAARRRGKG